MDSAAVSRLVSRSSTRHQYKKIGIIGEGAYGIVIQAECLLAGSNSGSNDRLTTESASSPSSSSPVFVAIKQMNVTRPGVGVAVDAYREMKLLRELKHPNIIRLKDIYIKSHQPEVDLVYDYCDFDLSDLVRHHRTSALAVDMRVMKSIVHSLCQALAYCHRNWCCHRDMKPANILIDSGGVVKIADFGLARGMDWPQRRLSEDGEVVTIWYRAPELLLGSKHYTTAIDIWALGCIFAELVACAPLFPGEELKGSGVFQEPQMKKLMGCLGVPTPAQWPEIIHCQHWTNVRDSSEQRNYKFRLTVKLGHAEFCASKGYELLTRMLDYDPSRRITAEEACEHAWFKEAPIPQPNVFMLTNNELLKLPPRTIKPLNAADGGSLVGATEPVAATRAEQSAEPASKKAKLAA